VTPPTLPGLERLRDSISHELPPLRRRAQALLENGFHAAAREIVEALILGGDVHPTTLLLFAVLLFDDGRPDHAREVLRAATDAAYAAGDTHLAISTEAWWQSTVKR
jgi:hypothetical protein